MAALTPLRYHLHDTIHSMSSSWRKPTQLRGLCQAPKSPLGGHQAASRPRAYSACCDLDGQWEAHPGREGEERILRAPGEELTGKFTVKWFQMTLLRLCHILDAWRNFICLDIFLTSGGNFKTLVGGNRLCSSFFGSRERSWKTGERLGWGILPTNSRQIAQLQIHKQHLFWWHLWLIKCH